MGCVVKEKVGYIEENTREVRNRTNRKEMVVCVQDLVGKKIFLVQSEYVQTEEIRPFLILFLCSKEEVEMDEPLSNSLEKEQGELLIIDGNNEVGEPCIFGRGMYFSVFYFVCVMLRRLQQICWRNRCGRR